MSIEEKPIVNEEKRIIAYFLLVGVMMVAVSMAIVYFISTEKTQMQEEGSLAKTDVAIVNKVIWNDVIVTWNIDRVPESSVQRLFKVKFEKYGEALKSMAIERGDNGFNMFVELKDGSTIRDFIR